MAAAAAGELGADVETAAGDLEVCHKATASGGDSRATSLIVRGPPVSGGYTTPSGIQNCPSQWFSSRFTQYHVDKVS